MDLVYMFAFCNCATLAQVRPTLKSWITFQAMAKHHFPLLCLRDVHQILSDYIRILTRTSDSK